MTSKRSGVGLALLASVVLTGCGSAPPGTQRGSDEVLREENVPKNRVFSIERGIRVPDGTLVYPFLNSKDRTSGLPWDLLDGLSVAAGEIEPSQSSKIHLMPVVSQVTFVLEGELEVRMKEPESPAPYTVRLKRHQAVLTKPYVFLQLINPSNRPTRVLYMVSPPYLFAIDSAGKIEYDDAIAFDQDWAGLEEANWRPEGVPDSAAAVRARTAAYELIAHRAGGQR